MDDFIAANVAKTQRFFEASYPLEQPTVLYRGIKDDNFLPRKQYADFIKGLKVGDVIDEPGFMSTTIDYDMAEGFANDGIVLQIEAPRGTRVGSPLMTGDLAPVYADPERELLLPPNTKLQITDIDDNLIQAKIVPADTPSTTYRTTRAALAEDMAVTAPDTPAPAGRVAPGFVSPEPVEIGNVATLPDGASVRLDAPEQSVEFVAAQGPLDQVPTQHLWQAISENAGEGKRYQIIGESGGHIGMTRYQDTATGQYLGLKYEPGMAPIDLDFGRIPGPLAEIMSNDVAVAVGFPDMNLRLIVNPDDTMSVVTELAQSVYGTKIYDTFGLNDRPPSGGPKIGNNVSIDSRMRKAIFDDLVTNRDNNAGNYLFAEQPDGSLSVVPIDNEITFQQEYMPEWGWRSNLFDYEPMNWSVRNKFLSDPDGLFEDIKQTVADVQKRLDSKTLDVLEVRLKKRLDDLVRRGTNVDPEDLEILKEQTMTEIEDTIGYMRNFSKHSTDYLANAYFKIIQQGVEGI
jgi:hypothetical protein